MKKVPTAEEILEKDDLKKEWVDVPEWKCGVYVRSLTAQEGDAFEADLVSLRGRSVKLNRENVTARYVQRCACDETGKLIFGEKDIVALGKKSTAALNRIYRAASKLNRFTEQDVEDILGNSESGPSGDNGSASPGSGDAR